jgi:predicted Zn-dependent protease with MMP-like domain
MCHGLPFRRKASRPLPEADDDPPAEHTAFAAPGGRLAPVDQSDDVRRADGIDPGEVSAEAFDAMVVDQLDLLPDDMVDGLDNIVFVTEDRPEDGTLDLLGLYDGVALTERGQYGFGELPDRIILYREPHLAAVDDLDQLADEIHVTLVHEIAHFYGIDDDQLHELGWA